MVPRAVQRDIDSLAGKGAGFAEALRRLSADPCDPTLGAYRLSGPLAPIICGLHLRRGFRVAFTMQPIDDEFSAVVILYVGKRQPRHRASDIWDVVHDLFDVGNPPADHHKPPCCQDGQPSIDDAALDAFLRALRRMQRGR